MAATASGVRAYPSWLARCPPCMILYRGQPSRLMISMRHFPQHRHVMAVTCHGALLSGVIAMVINVGAAWEMNTEQSTMIRTSSTADGGEARRANRGPPVREA